MAGLAPFFLTGGSAKIKLNGKTIAFCDNFTYQVTVPTITPHFLGMYEAPYVEPMSYNVSGSFSIIRYTKGAAEVFKENSLKTPSSTSEKGNGIAQWGGQNEVGGMLNPSRLDNTIGFEIVVYQKMPDGQQVGMARLRNCRVVGADFNINKRSAARQNFNFMCSYLDEDTFAADFSGNGAHF